MKRWVHSAEEIGNLEEDESSLKGTSSDNRIEIDFYGVDLGEEIEAAKKPQRRVLKNTQVVIRDVTAYLTNKGLKVLNAHKSSNQDSDSTYYDVDVKIMNPNGKVGYIYFRISDHREDPNMKESRNSYHNNLTNKYDSSGTAKWDYFSIVVQGKKYDNYDRAMNFIKKEIDVALQKEGLI